MAFFGGWDISGFPFWVTVVVSESKHQESSVSGVPTPSENVEDQMEIHKISQVEPHKKMG